MDFMMMGYITIGALTANFASVYSEGSVFPFKNRAEAKFPKFLICSVNFIITVLFSCLLVDAVFDPNQKHTAVISGILIANALNKGEILEFLKKQGNK